MIQTNRDVKCSIEAFRKVNLRIDYYLGENVKQAIEKVMLRNLGHFR